MKKKIGDLTLFEIIKWFEVVDDSYCDKIKCKDCKFKGYNCEVLGDITGMDNLDTEIELPNKEEE